MSRSSHSAEYTHIKALRSLAVGESFWGGGGALPEWRVVRKG